MLGRDFDLFTDGIMPAIVGLFFVTLVGAITYAFFFEKNHPCLEYRQDTCYESECTFWATSGDPTSPCWIWQTHEYPCSVCARRAP